MSYWIPIDRLEGEELSFYQVPNETALLRANEPKSGYFLAESALVISRALDDGYEPVSFLIHEDQLTKEGAHLHERCADVPCYAVKKELFQSITGFAMTRGVLSLMRRRSLADPREWIRGKKRIAVLEDVVNPTNMGAIFRSAAALGIEGVLLTRGCTDPLYRRSARVSMGTVFQVPWTFLEEDTWMEMLKEEGYTLAAMALKNDSYLLGDVSLRSVDRLAVILGTEGTGLKDETIEKADLTIKIPMSHGVDSLNVAAASAVVFWEICKK